MISKRRSGDLRVVQPRVTTGELGPSAIDIARECDELKANLLEKNAKYGDSALEPIRIFSKAPADEQIKVRLDDKINRLLHAKANEDEDVTFDLLGYLILLRIARRRAKEKASK